MSVHVRRGDGHDWGLPRLNERSQYEKPNQPHRSGSRAFHIYVDNYPCDIKVGQRFNCPGCKTLEPGNYRFSVWVWPRSWHTGGGAQDPQDDIVPADPETSLVSLFAGTVAQAQCDRRS